MDYCYEEYSRAITGSGGAPALIPVAQNRDSLKSLFSRLDGLLLSGGPDVNPRHYSEAPGRGLGEVDDALDRMELAAARLASRMQLPVLAICRGIQVLTVALGGSLFQDIGEQVEAALNHLQKADKSTNTHRITISADSRLHEIVRSRRIWVNGKHHQAVQRPGAGLRVVALAEDGVVEAVEDPQHPFFIGVQWHPEGTWTADRYSRRLFAAFVAAASEARKT
jgi:putative glutamine amidotransferase